MLEFYSPGKLLITAEYFVLSGAKAFALPTQQGQSIRVTPIEEGVVRWKSYTNSKKIWMDLTLSLGDFECIASKNTALPLIQKLQDILKCVRIMEPKFCTTGFEVSTDLTFDRNWGLGSSSTLIHNIAQWASVNPFKLLQLTFGGSGYDVAVAQAKSALFFTRNQYAPLVEPFRFDPPFKDQLYFVYLNQKQDSQKEVAAFNKGRKAAQKEIDHISQISESITQTKSLDGFNKLLFTHEKLVGLILEQIPIKERLFSDFEGEIKSLGAWGGDFILATGKSSPNYFKEKGYATILPYSDIISTQ